MSSEPDHALSKPSSVPPTGTSPAAGSAEAKAGSRGRSPSGKPKSSKEALENWTAAQVEKWFKTYKDGKYAAEYPAFAGLDGSSLSKLTQAEFCARSQKGDLLFQMVVKATAGPEESSRTATSKALNVSAHSSKMTKSPSRTGTLHLNKEAEEGTKAVTRGSQTKGDTKPKEAQKVSSPASPTSSSPASPTAASPTAASSPTAAASPTAASSSTAVSSPTAASSPTAKSENEKKNEQATPKAARHASHDDDSDDPARNSMESIERLLEGDDRAVKTQITIESPDPDHKSAAASGPAEIHKQKCEVESCDAMAVQGTYCAHHRIKKPDEAGMSTFSGSFVLGENSAESDKKLHDKLEAIFNRFAAQTSNTMDKGRWIAACESLNLVDSKTVRRLDVELVFNVIKPVKGKPVLQFEHFCRGLSQIALKKYPDKGGRSLRYMVRTDLARA